MTNPIQTPVDRLVISKLRITPDLRRVDVAGWNVVLPGSQDVDFVLRYSRVVPFPIQRTPGHLACKVSDHLATRSR